MERHPGESRGPDVVPTNPGSSAGQATGTISKTGSRFPPGTLDSGFRRNDGFNQISAFSEFISARFPEKPYTQTRRERRTTNDP
ncbi:MAG: hypothetical protein AMJ94_06145 [Deltaproteobacteria bacterium SM23_61]|nr:MAG: hypothetical protein AMJ94_06145 [Deltaproteobacteria bacterium SM23_61]